MFNLKKSLNIRQLKEIAKIGWILFSGYRKYLLILFFLGFLSSFAGALGINAIIPLFSFFIDGGGVSAGTDFISQFIKDSFLFLGIPFSLPSVLVLISILFAIKAGMLYLFDYIKIRIKTKFQQDLMNKVFKKSLQADWTYLMKQRIGYLETLIRTDVVVTTRILDILSKLLMTITSLIVYTAVALSISQTVTVMTIFIGLVLIFVFKPLFVLSKKYAQQTTMLNKTVAQHVNEHISGIKTVKANGIEGEVGSLGGKLFKKFRYLQIKTFLTARISTLLTEPIGVVFISCVVAFTYYQTSYNLGALIAVIYLIKQIFTFIQSSLKMLHTVSEALPYAKEVVKYQKQVSDNKESRKENGNESFSFQDNIKFEDVVFEYENGKKALNKVNFEIKKGEMVGFIGPSGGGKSTIFDMLLRFFEPTEGRFLIDGEKVQNISIKDWRKNVAYVPQEIFLLNDSIKENIRFRNKDISEDDIVKASKEAYLYDFIMNLPNGFDTNVGERGLMLSGGQKQRLVVARALARNPEILLLDEATSALDKESEKIIQKVLREKRKDTTILAIGHKLSTIKEADKLIVVDSGEIIESGDPKELLEQKGTYFSKVYNMKI